MPPLGMLNAGAHRLSDGVSRSMKAPVSSHERHRSLAADNAIERCCRVATLATGTRIVNQYHVGPVIGAAHQRFAGAVWGAALEDCVDNTRIFVTLRRSQQNGEISLEALCRSRKERGGTGRSCRCRGRGGSRGGGRGDGRDRTGDGAARRAGRGRCT